MGEVLHVCDTLRNAALSDCFLLGRGDGGFELEAGIEVEMSGLWEW